MFFLIFLHIYPVFAQARLGDFSIRGTASQEIESEGFIAAHSSLPLNSKVKVTNPRNGREIEVTVVHRIESSANRIIDLSREAVQALDMKAGEAVILTVGSPLRPISQTTGFEDHIMELYSFSPFSQVKNDPVNISGHTDSVATAVINDKGKDSSEEYQNPGNINKSGTEEGNNICQTNKLINNLVKGVDETAIFAGFSTNTQFLAWLMAMTIDAREAREYRERMEIREYRARE